MQEKKPNWFSKFEKEYRKETEFNQRLNNNLTYSISS